MFNLYVDVNATYFELLINELKNWMKLQFKFGTVTHICNV